MIRKLLEEDHEQILSLLRKEPSFNLFIIGDLEAFGYDKEFQDIWGEFNQQGELIAILLRFYQSFIPYSLGSFNVSEFVSIMRSFNQPIFLSGKSEITEKFEQYSELNLGKKQVMYFAECLIAQPLNPPTMEIFQATMEDVDQIIQLRNSIEEFNVRSDARDILIKSMESNTARTYYTQEDGLMSSCVSTSAENSMSAMIVGVCTKKDFRRQGLATAIMQKLIKDVLDEGKTLCLFYDNPEAGRIYKRLGFKDIGMWTLYR